jgi:hypothetical protein
MIQKFVDKYMADKAKIQEALLEDKYKLSYEKVVGKVIDSLTELEWDYDYPAPKMEDVSIICGGDYQGYDLYVFKAFGTDRIHYYLYVGYGSCSHCDTLQSIDSELRSKDVSRYTQGVENLMMLTLHIVQGLKKIGEE